MNKAILMGRLTRDPEVRYSQSANPVAVARYGLAVRRSFVKPGEQDVDFFNIVAWSKLADIATNHLSKGVRVGIIGYIQNRCWEKEDGTKKYITDYHI